MYILKNLIKSANAFHCVEVKLQIYIYIFLHVSNLRITCKGLGYVHHTIDHYPLGVGSKRTDISGGFS